MVEYAREAFQMAKSLSGGKQVDFHVGERIRERRAELGLTQEDLGRALRISYQQIQKYETGANRVSAGRLFEIATALNVGISYFFEGYHGGGPGEPLPHGGHNRAAIELVRNFLEIKDEGVRAAVSMLIRALKDQDGSRPAKFETYDASRHS
jgi:transcriptional regulator with XRE-family HTH domain